MNHQKIPLDYRNQLREMLEPGDIMELSRRLRCSRSTIYRFFTGENSYTRILEGIMDYVQQKERIYKRLEKMCM